MRPVVLILGSGSDIGAELARQYAEQEHPVYLLGRDPTRLQSLENALSGSRSPRVRGYICDITDDERFEAVLSDLDPFPEIVIVTAGLMLENETPDADAIRELMRVNAESPAIRLQQMASEFERRGIAGVLVGVSSLAGERGRGSNYPYGAAKAAFTAYLSGLRHRMHGTGIHFMTVLPGFVQTKMIAGMQTPKSLTIAPDDMAERIRVGIEKRVNVVYSGLAWRVIRLILMLLPEWMFKRTKL